tara:strand:- start:5760 stop:6131 length:372 start_codon:yes stop_codon:yes gene_type:complete
MGQRVNIQYSVELEDLEQEVNRLYSNAITQIAALPHASLNLGTEGLDKVDSFRQKLAKVDIMLGDVQNIIEGYIRFKTQPPPEREQTFQQTSDELEVEQLEDQIAKFKEMLSAQPDQEPEESN